MVTNTSVPSSLAFFNAISTDVSTTLCNTSHPCLSSLNPSMPNTASRKPTRLITKDVEHLCIYCVLLARIGFIPNLTSSEIFFLRKLIDVNAGFINNASLALK